MTSAGFPHSDIHGSNARSTANRGLSQPTTSFIGSRRQGIHRWLFIAWNYKTHKPTTTNVARPCHQAPPPQRRLTLKATPGHKTTHQRAFPQNGTENETTDNHQAQTAQSSHRHKPARQLEASPTTTTTQATAADEQDSLERR